MAARVRKQARQQHPHAAVPVALADVFDGDRSRVEHDTVVHEHCSDVAEHVGHGLFVARPETQEIGVARGSVRHVVPEREQQRALEDEAVGMGGTAQAIQKTLQRKAHQHLVEIDSGGPGDVEQACAH